MMEFLSIASPVYSAPDNSTIDAIVDTSKFQAIPYTFTAQEWPKIFARLEAGEFGPVGPYVAPEVMP